MRSDMSKVVIERPRRKGWHTSGSVKTGRKIRYFDANEEYENLPKHEKYSMGYQGGKFVGKCFSDLIGPLFRFLRSNVGRPWDKVYSEMCEHLDFRKTIGRHIFEHVQQLVSLHCFIGEDQKIYEVTRWSHHQLVEGLYVHPRTQLLCWKQRQSWQAKQHAKIAAQPITCIPVEGNQYHIKLNGLWYKAELESGYKSFEDLQAAGYVRPERFQCFEYNPTLHIPRYWRAGDKQHYWILSKRQLSAKELKAAKLSNDAG